MTLRFPWLPLQVLALCLCLGFAPDASARTHAGLCAPTAESMEAPPPIYPRAETYARGCETQEEGTEFSTHVPERPMPVVELRLDSAKAPPPHGALGRSKPPSAPFPFPARDRDGSTEYASRLLRPPRA